MIHNTTLHKTAFITGGAKRIGKAISQTLHADGFNVIVHYHHSQYDAKNLCKKLNQIRPDSAVSFGCDLAVIEEQNHAKTFFKSVKDAFGRIDVLVHNASSFYATPKTDDWENLHRAWNDLFLTNAKAPYFLSQLFFQELQKNQGNIISILDIHADNKPFLDHCIYTMAKASHRAMVQSLALEFAPFVCVNGVSPGVNIFPDNDEFFNLKVREQLQDSVPLGKAGTPDDIAKAVLFFAKSSYITGQILAVDGGRSLTLKGG